MPMSPLRLLTLCFFGTGSAGGLRIPFQARSPSPESNYRLQSRASVAVKSEGNVEYLVNITVGGEPFAVLLDTGSSDLWLTGNIQTKGDLGKSASVQYAVGSATGEIMTAEIGFAGNTVEDQALIYVKDRSSTGIDLTGFNGLLGVGPSSSSNVYETTGSTRGLPFLDRVFRQNTSTQNFITFLLERAGDTGENFSGQLTIGEVIPSFENVTSQPKVPLAALPGALKVDQHFASSIDGITGPDGKNIPLSSIVPGTPSGQLIAVYDSGFSLSQVSRHVSDAIYGRVRGASFNTTNGFWTVPCDQEVNLTIVIAGQTYPVHSLDTSSSDLGGTDANGKPVCVGTYQPITSALDGTFDLILGMPFLRNAYTLINFGNFVDGNPENQGPPYMQFLSVTNSSDAHRDFVNLRLKGVDTTGDSTLLPESQAQHSPSSTGEKAKTALFRYWPWLLGATALLILVGVVGCISRCCRRRRGTGFRAGSYRPLQDPSPGREMDLQTMDLKGSYADPYRSGPQIDPQTGHQTGHHSGHLY